MQKNTILVAGPPVRTVLSILSFTFHHRTESFERRLSYFMIYNGDCNGALVHRLTSCLSRSILHIIVDTEGERAVVVRCYATRIWTQSVEETQLSLG